jgi:hypothetical protein
MPRHLLPAAVACRQCVPGHREQPMSRAMLTTSMFVLALPCAAQQQVPMTATFSVTGPTTLEIVAYDGPALFDVVQACAGPGGEGGCVNLPGGRGGDRPSYAVALTVPNAPALCGLEFTLYAAQLEPLVYGVATTTVTCEY